MGIGISGVYQDPMHFQMDTISWLKNQFFLIDFEQSGYNRGLRYATEEIEASCSGVASYPRSAGGSGGCACGIAGANSAILTVHDEAMIRQIKLSFSARTIVYKFGLRAKRWSR